MRLREAVPMLSRSTSSELTRIIRSARRDSSFEGKVKPFTPSETRSYAQPHWLETRTGSPAAIASFTTSPQVSLWEGRMNALARP